MKTTLIKSNERGHANHGWLEAYHMFSFANYYNPEKMGFGTLRVLNDDVIQGGTGFGQHPHQNMEIITVPIEGALKHRDSIGNEGVITSGEVQVMSAGTGVVHAELNGLSSEPTNITQIWIIPNKENVEPRYDQLSFSFDANTLQQIVSPNPDDEGTWIHANAWIYHGVYDHSQEFTYSKKADENGVFVFLIEGKLNVSGVEMNRRDGLGVEGQKELRFEVLEDARFLLLDVPM